MKNGKVSTLVNTILGTPPSDWEHIQTVKIPERSHQKLRALAELMGRSKTALAAELLIAAIDEALDSLPDTKLDKATRDKLLGYIKGFGDFDDDLPTTLRETVARRADDLYRFVQHEREEAELMHAGMQQDGVDK